MRKAAGPTVWATAAMTRRKWVKTVGTSPDDSCRRHVGASLTSHPHLPICTRARSSHRVCWVQALRSINWTSFCCQSRSFQNIWALPNEWLVRPPLSSQPCLFLPSPSFHRPAQLGEGEAPRRTLWVMREISGRDALEVRTLHSSNSVLGSCRGACVCVTAAARGRRKEDDWRWQMSVAKRWGTW